jgi:hypothetical protein
MSSPEESSTSELFDIERRVLGVLVVLETLRIADLDDDLLLALGSVRAAKQELVNEVMDPAEEGRDGSKVRKEMHTKLPPCAFRSCHVYTLSKTSGTFSLRFTKFRQVIGTITMRSELVELTARMEICSQPQGPRAWWQSMFGPAPLEGPCRGRPR